MKLLLSFFTASILFFSVDIKNEGLEYYFPDDIRFDSEIPTPEEFFGYKI